MTARSSRQPAVHLTLDSRGLVVEATGGLSSLGRLFGDPTPQGRHIDELVPGGELTEWWDSLLATDGEPHLGHLPLLLRTPAGSHWTLVSGASLKTKAEGGVAHVLLQFSHITPVPEGRPQEPAAGSDVSQGESRLSESVYQRAFLSAASGLTLTSIGGVLLQVNDSFAGLVGRPRDQVIGRSVMLVLHADSWAQWQDAVTRLLRGERDHVRMERRYVRPDGSSVSTETSAALLRDDDGQPEALFTQVMDISEHLRRTEELAFAAEHDPLTGLANRLLVEGTLNRWLVEAERQGGCVAALLIDLDGFKAVNDTYGHATGDALLTAVAARVRGAIRQGDLAGRLGGDEFVVVARADHREQLAALAQRLVAALRGTIAVAGVSLVVRASVGMAVVSPNADTSLVGDSGFATERVAAAALGLIRAADLAMYDDKRRAGRDSGKSPTPGPRS